MHPALSGVLGGAVRRRRLVNEPLLDNGAVHRETVWSGRVGGGGGRSVNKRFEDCILVEVRVDRSLRRTGRLTITWEFQSPTLV